MLVNHKQSYRQTWSGIKKKVSFSSAATNSFAVTQLCQQRGNLGYDMCDVVAAELSCVLVDSDSNSKTRNVGSASRPLGLSRALRGHKEMAGLTAAGVWVDSGPLSHHGPLLTLQNRHRSDSCLWELHHQEGSSFLQERSSNKTVEPCYPSVGLRGLLALHMPRGN